MKCWYLHAVESQKASKAIDLCAVVCRRGPSAECRGGTEASLGSSGGHPPSTVFWWMTHNASTGKQSCWSRSTHILQSRAPPSWPRCVLDDWDLLGVAPVLMKVIVGVDMGGGGGRALTAVLLDSRLPANMVLGACIGSLCKGPAVLRVVHHFSFFFSRDRE